MIHLYDRKVQEGAARPGPATEKEMRKRSVRFRSLCLPENLTDRFLIDEYRAGFARARIIPDTEDLRPYITTNDKKQKWIREPRTWH